MLFLEKYFDDFDLENTCASIEFESKLELENEGNEYLLGGVATFVLIQAGVSGLKLD